MLGGVAGADHVDIVELVIVREKLDTTVREKEIKELLRETGLPEDGKTILFDGHTGEPFDQKVTVGVMYMLKLHHLVKKKFTQGP